MKRLTVMLLVFAIFVSNGIAQQPQQSGTLQDPPWLKEFAFKRIVYSVPGMTRVKVVKGRVYKRVDGAELKMDVYSPLNARRGAPRPAVIFIHGGRIPPNLRTTPKEWGAYVSLGQIVAASGFVGVAFNHRFYTWNSLPDSQSDLNDLITHVRNEADSLGVDKDRIILWAVSAGGVFLGHPLRDAQPYIRCIVGYYPQLDLQNARESAPASVTDETLREFSPIHQLGTRGKGVPPIFIARAGLDEAALNDGVDRFVQLALSKNLTIEVVNHATGHHAFDIMDDNDRSREILRRTIEFIKTHG